MSRTADERWERLAEWRPSRALVARRLVVSTAGFFAFAYLFGGVAAALSGRPFEPIVVPAFARFDGLALVATVVALAALVVVVHELLHGLAMARYGGRPGYGVGVSNVVVPYAYASTGGTFSRNEMLAVLLAPFVGITLAGLAALAVVPAEPVVLVLALAINAAGSVGDCWTAAALLRYPPSVRVGGLPDSAGVGIYAPADGDAASARSRIRERGSRVASSFCLGAVYALAAVVAGLCALVLASLAVGTGTVVLGDPDGSWFLFRHELRPASGDAVVEVGVPAVVGLSAAGGLARVAAAVVRDALAGEP